MRKTLLIKISALILVLAFSISPAIAVVGPEPDPEPDPDPIVELIQLKNGMGLDPGIDMSLGAKLNAAMAALERGREKTAINNLNAFINQVNAQTGKKITEEDADPLISAAQAVIQNIGQ